MIRLVGVLERLPGAFKKFFAPGRQKFRLAGQARLRRGGRLDGQSVRPILLLAEMIVKQAALNESLLKELSPPHSATGLH